MKNQIVKGFLCVAAAAFMSNSLQSHTIIYAAAGQQVQKVEDEEPKGAVGTKEDQPQAAENTSTSANKSHPESEDASANKQNLEGSDTSANGKGPEDGDASGNEPEDADTSAKKPEDEDTSVNEPKDEDASANEPEDEDASANEPENPTNPVNSHNPDESEEPAEPAESSESEDPKKPDKEKPNKEKPEKEKPEKPKLSKPLLTAASKPNGTIRLSWNKVSGASEYVILCSTKKDSGFHRIYSCTKGTSYKDQNRVPGKVYYYKLAVFSKERASRADSKTVSGRPLEKARLTGISNLSGSGDLVLSWNPVAGASGYQILRKNASTGKYEEAGSVKGAKTTYTDHNRSGGSIYSYKVYAKDADGGRGNYSNAMSQMAIDKNKKMIALTYDDGPSAYTPLVLDALAKYGGHATFFVVGSSVNRYADSLRRAVALGCEIGNHTYSHNNLKNLSAAQVQSALQATSQAVRNLTGAEVRLLRPPYGSYSASTSSAAGMPVIMWSIDTLDWKTRSTSATIQCVQSKAYDGAIILMHDLHQPTAMAADAVMKNLTDAGYQLVTVSELAAYRGGLQIGSAYNQFRR